MTPCEICGEPAIIFLDAALGDERHNLCEAHYQWKPFQGEYVKRFYDVKLSDGSVLTECWPNAGYLNHLETGRKFRSQDNVLFRPTLCEHDT